MRLYRKKYTYQECCDDRHDDLGLDPWNPCRVNDQLVVTRSRWCDNIENSFFFIGGLAHIGLKFLINNVIMHFLNTRTSVAPPCSSWDTGRVAPFIFSLGVKFQLKHWNCDTKVAV